MQIADESKVRLARALLALALLAVVADTVYRAGPRERTDLPVYLAGSREVLAGRDPLLVQSGRGWPYVYPPTAAVLLAPLTPLPLRVSAGLWCVVSIGVLGLGLSAWRGLLPLGAAASSGEGAGEGSPAPESVALAAGASAASESAAPADSGALPTDLPAQEPAPGGEVTGPRRGSCPWVWELALPCVLILLPALSGLLRGQVGPLLLGCGLLAWRDLRRGHDLRAGGLLALCAAIKLTPLFVIVGLAAARRWRAVAGAGLGLVLFLGVLPLPFLGPQRTAASLEHFGRHMILRPLSDPSDPDMTSLNTHVPRNQSLIALGVRRLSGIPKLLALGILALLVPLALCRAGWRFDLGAYALLWGLPLLIAPVAWHHHHVLAFFALALLGARRSRLLGVFALAALGHFALAPLRPYGALALGTLVVLGAAAWPARPSLVESEPTPAT